ncbi:hypothetical protein ACQEVB_07545 [Pseudonocardia sp. CA-107938]|uniref:hypothetical protein n=1 Tax=Pseudonocardia sp. CA-107938 TaxID=3240021 RepID=UPI003D92A532
MRSGSVVRGGALATLSAVLTAAGHLAGGGTLGDLTLLAVLLPLLAVGFTSAAAACRSFVAAALVLGAGQVMLHQAMVLMHPPHASGSAAFGTAAMLGMHAAVTVVMASALRCADGAVSALLAVLRRVLPRRFSPLPVVRPLRLAVVAAPVPGGVRAAVLAGPLVRRGPPVTC